MGWSCGLGNIQMTMTSFHEELLPKGGGVISLVGGGGKTTLMFRLAA
jgi:hypothetical protein